MCGIGGFYSQEMQLEKRESVLSGMAKSLKYRGPDVNDFKIFERVGLVHNRLKIIDLSNDANQPMLSSCGKYYFVFNGEIYNFKELVSKFDLPKLRTSSDSEVLMECLINYDKKEVLNTCVGMFAFCLVELDSQKLVFGRDRHGQKPLYYYHKLDELIFCSDIRGVSKAVDSLSLDYNSVDYYLSELAMPQPGTIFKEVKQIPSGSLAYFDEGKLFFEKYHTFSMKNYDHSLDQEEWLGKIEKQLTDAIQIRSFSDVNIGYFLSGGVDSGLIVALMAQHSEKRLNTFTVVYDEKDFDESRYARELAEKYNTKHTELKINSDNVENSLWELLEEFGEPFADSSALPSYFVSREMKKHVTVAISGDGGDELFGYWEYKYALELEKFQKQGSLSQFLKSLKSKFFNRIQTGNKKLDASLRHSLKNMENGHLLDRKMAFTEEEKKKLYRIDELRETDYLREYHSGIWKNVSSSSIYGKKWLGSFETRLKNDYLTKVDRSSMANSLEVRSPFLDHRLVELISKIPPSMNFQNGTQKYLLKILAERHVCSGIMDRKKLGFGIPVRHWLKGPLKPLVNKFLGRESVEKRGFFDYEFISKLVKEHDEEICDHSHKIWALLWLEMWMSVNYD